MLPRTVVRVEFSSIIDLTVKKKIDILLNILSDEYDQNCIRYRGIIDWR